VQQTTLEVITIHILRFIAKVKAHNWTDWSCRFCTCNSNSSTIYL